MRPRVFRKPNIRRSQRSGRLTGFAACPPTPMARPEAAARVGLIMRLLEPALHARHPQLAALAPIQRGKIVTAHEAVRLIRDGDTVAQLRRHRDRASGVFRLCAEGLELIEVAPGIDLQRDILGRMDFAPLIKATPALMEAALFSRPALGLRERMLRLPLPERFAYDAQQNTLFINFGGHTVKSLADVEAIRAQVTRLIEPLGHRVRAIVNNDNFTLFPDLLDAYAAMVKDLEERYYSIVSR
jgi:hypothetical protein